MDDELRQKIRSFLKKHRLTVIATIDTKNNRPEAACIAFAEKDTLELVFGTPNTSRKYQNLEHNKNVSFVIGWSDELGTVQYEGVARELSGEEAVEHGTLMAEKNENARAFLTRETQRYFLVTPTWIRLVDKSTSPQEVFEMSLEN
ncbi:MAG TPA: pyridoxamine 5'-phosphate oxidase family protein [Candidatus Paceibacterota bacterium]|jgi:pyridoxine/pyridoxamine 5'-phosphate oxidase